MINARSGTLWVLFLLLLSGRLAAEEAIDHYLDAQSLIKSYDVIMVADYNSYKKIKNDQKPLISTLINTETNRDIFAVDLGRRIEEADHQISVKDWNTATSEGPQLANSLTRFLPGSTYLDYINPPLSGLFLTDVLRDKKSAIRIVNPSSADPGIVGFEVSHPSVRGIVRVWLDSLHNYMPKELDCFIEATDGLYLTDRMRVQEFIKVEGVGWLPAKATWDMDPSRKSWNGYSVRLDEEHSAFNSIHSPDLFLPKSMPAVNWEESGWKIYYPPEMLVAIKAAREFERKLDKEAAERKKIGNASSRWVRYILVGQFVLVLGYLVFRVVNKRLPGNIQSSRDK